MIRRKKKGGAKYVIPRWKRTEKKNKPGAVRDITQKKKGGGEKEKKEKSLHSTKKGAHGWPGMLSNSRQINGGEKVRPSAKRGGKGGGRGEKEPAFRHRRKKKAGSVDMFGSIGRWGQQRGKGGEAVQRGFHEGRGSATAMRKDH